MIILTIYFIVVHFMILSHLYAYIIVFFSYVITLISLFVRFRWNIKCFKTRHTRTNMQEYRELRSRRQNIHSFSWGKPGSLLFVEFPLSRLIPRRATSGRPRKGNGRSRNFNDHPSRSTANFSCARNSLGYASARYFTCPKKNRREFLEERRAD